MADYYDSEWLSRDGLRRVQDERLKETARCAAEAPFYAARFADLGLDPGRFAGLEALQTLPPTTKGDLRAGMPYGFLAVPRKAVVRMHYSSGTTGTATAVYHTRDDLRRWAECVARGMRGVGVTADDVFQNMMSYGLFTGGLGFHYAAELIGCLTIPVGAGNTARQVELLRQFAVTVVHLLPSYALRVVHFCEEENLSVAENLSLRIGFIGAEPHTERTRRRIETMLCAKLYNCYGLSEMCGPGVALECPAQDGLHIREDHYLAEILDPQTLEPVPEGEQGELVLTTLTREAMPLLRYRTRDVTRFLPGACPCGRQHRRIERILGRSDDMLIVRGVNLYPMQIERVLMGLEEVGSNYLIKLKTERDMDDLLVQVEMRPGLFYDDLRQLEALRQKIAAALKAELLLTPHVEIVPARSLPVTDGKAVRVIDERER
jgi:phenylacetate-CoA ligase